MARRNVKWNDTKDADKMKNPREQKDENQVEAGGNEEEEEEELRERATGSWLRHLLAIAGQ